MNITFIFDRFRRSSAAVTAVKYECDSRILRSTFRKSKILLTEKSANGALVTLTPELTQAPVMACCLATPKILHEPMLTYHQWCSVAITLEQFRSSSGCNIMVLVAGNAISSKLELWIGDITGHTDPFIPYWDCLTVIFLIHHKTIQVSHKAHALSLPLTIVFLVNIILLLCLKDSLAGHMAPCT